MLEVVCVEKILRGTFEGFFLSEIKWSDHAKDSLWVLSLSQELPPLLGELPEQGLAVVGTRQPEHRSFELMEQTFEKLAGSRLIIVSGLARGIDALSHACALRAGLRCVGVLGGGFNHFYPPENIRLARAVLEAGGILIAEYPPDREPRKYQFKHRNRLIASLAKATWIVEAGIGSGAINTAHWASDLERTLLVTGCAPWDTRRGGNQEVFRKYAAIPFFSAEDFNTVWLGIVSPKGARMETVSEPLTTLETETLEIVERLQGTNGAVLDFVINSLTEEKNLASDRIFLLFQSLMRKERLIAKKGTLWVRLEKSPQFRLK